MSQTSKTLQDLFDIQVEDLKTSLDSLSIFDDPDEYAAIMLELEGKLNALHGLMDIREALAIDDSSYESQQAMTLTLPETEDDSDFKTATLTKFYVFERKLRGGVVHLENNNDYYIPEQMVRDMGIIHGAKVSIIDKYEHNNALRYIFHIHENGVTDRPGRIEIKECRVEIKNFDKLYAVHPVTKQSFALSPGDIKAYGLNYMDTVDIAYYENNSSNISVIHKYSRPPYAKSTTTAMVDSALVATDEYGLSAAKYKELLKEKGFVINRLTLCFGTEMMFTLNSYASTNSMFIVDPSLKDNMSKTIQLFENAGKKVHFLSYLDDLKGEQRT